MIDQDGLLLHPFHQLIQTHGIRQAFLLLDPEIVQAQMHRGRSLDLVGDSAAALDGAAIYNPDRPPLRQLQEYGFLGTQPRKTRHLRDTAPVQFEGELVGELSRGGTA
jgi:hypothetical protein